MGYLVKLIETNREDLISESNRFLDLQFREGQASNAYMAFFSKVIDSLVRYLNSQENGINKPDLTKMYFDFNMGLDQVIDAILACCTALDKFAEKYISNDKRASAIQLRAFFDTLIRHYCIEKDQFFLKRETEYQHLIQKLKVVKNDLQTDLNAMYQLIKNAPVGMAGCDARYQVEFWNPMATRLTGYKPADILKRSILNLFTFSSQAQFLDKMANSNRWITRMKLSIQLKTGNELPVILAIGRIKNAEENDIQYVLSFTDFTKEETIRKQMDRINQLSSVARLAGTVMHDIRNPINTISLNIDVLEQFLVEDQSLKTNYEEILIKIQRQLGLLKNNLDDYLCYSRLTEPSLQRIDITKYLSDYLLDIKLKYTSSGITIQIRMNADKIMVNADWIQLQRALENVIQNAFESITSNGLIQIEARATKKRFLISIIDNGCGMEEDVRRNMYKPYFSTRTAGTGLGLFIVREIIRGQNGRIYCTSKKGTGTRFTISLPLLS